MSTDAYRLSVGLIGLGLEAYWDQFDGLKARLEGYLQEVSQRMASGQRAD